MKTLRLISSIAKVKAGLPHPFSAAIDLTDKCNFRCRMCGIWKKSKKATLDPEVFRRCFENSSILKKVRVFNFGGGEPFLLNNLDSFVETVIRYSRPFQIRFVTNGYLTDAITRTMKGLLEKYKVSFGIKISIDGLGQTHNALRGMPDAFERAMKTLDALIGLKEKYPERLSINLGFTVNSENYRDLKGVRDLCDKKGVGFFFKPVINVNKFCSGEFDDSLFLNKEQVSEIMRFGDSLASNLKGLSLKERFLYRQYYTLQNRFLESGKRLLPCYAGAASFYMTPDGTVTPCLLWNESIGNINDKEFDEIWLSPFATALRKKIKKAECSCMTSCDTMPSLLVHKFPFYF